MASLRSAGDQRPLTATRLGCAHTWQRDAGARCSEVRSCGCRPPIVSPVRPRARTPPLRSPRRSLRAMPVDVDSAERFMLATARLLDRHRLAVVLHGAPVTPVLDALRAYRNPDGGFGHALEPDVRAPESEPAATLHALEV